MLTWFAMTLSAHAQDIYDVSMYLWAKDFCRTPLAEFDRVPMITERFYVDFFEGRPSPPAFGEWGDFWFSIDRTNNAVYYMDGTRIPRWTNPRDVDPGDEMWYLEDVGQVYHDIGSSGTHWYIYLYETTNHTQWWDVIVNSDANVDEPDYTNNWAEEQAWCN